MEGPQISFVLPAYNEKDHIKETIGKVNSVLENSGFSYEIVVVDDGSTDGTRRLASECTKYNGNVKVIGYHENVGKGYALKTGFFNTTGEIVVFIDSDLDIDSAQIKRYFHALEYGDIAVASKRHPQSHVETPVLRKFLSLGFNTLVRLLTGLKTKDTQSGLKALRRKSSEKVFSALTVKRFAFDVELLTVASLYGLKIVEVPVDIRMTYAIFSPKEIVRMFIDLLGITYRLKIKRSYPI